MRARSRDPAGWKTTPRPVILPRMNATESRLIDRLTSTITHLSESIGPRPPGSAAERLAAEWVAGQFAAMGYAPAIEPFDCPAHGALAASLAGPGEAVDIAPTQHTPCGSAVGPLHWLGAGEGHLRGEPAGKIGLLLAGGSLQERHRLLDRLESAGLAGVIVVTPSANSVNGKIVRSGRARRMLTATVSDSGARRLRARAGQTVTLTITGDRPSPAGQSQNVVAELPGAGPNRLIVWAHYDTAAGSPGAGDNASGTALLLELARELAGRELPATVQFVATGAEEFGGEDACGHGAKAFLTRRAGDLERTIAAFDIDYVGEALGVRRLRAAGPRAVIDAVPAFDNVHRADRRSTSCDSGSAYHFGLANVTLMDDTGSPHLHTPEDTIDTLDLAALAEMLGVCRRTVEALAAIDPPCRFARTGGVLIRPARWDDLEAVAEITRDAFGPFTVEKLRADFFGEPLGGRMWDAYKVAGVCDAARGALDNFIVAEADGRLVGYASYGLDAGRRLAMVGNNAVRPECQGRGIATAMQCEIMARFTEEGYDRWTVTTLDTDLPAQKVYGKMGFEEIVRNIIYLRKP